MANPVCRSTTILSEVAARGAVMAGGSHRRPARATMPRRCFRCCRAAVIVSAKYRPIRTGFAQYEKGLSRHLAAARERGVNRGTLDEFCLAVCRCGPDPHQPRSFGRHGTDRAALATATGGG